MHQKILHLTDYIQKNKSYLSLALIINVFLIYMPHLITNPANVDYVIIVKPLKEVSNLNDYISLIKKQEIVDIQPVRDLSHLIDVNLDRFFGVEFFGELQNIFILLITSYLLYYIFCLILPPSISMLGIFTFVNHPSIYSIYIEETSRKHILSFMFLLITFYLYQKFKESSKKKILITSYFTYLFSLFSCPITIMSPFLLAFHERKNLKKVIFCISPYFFTSLIIGLGNIYYYKTAFVTKQGFERTYSLLEPVQFFQIIGLYFRQIFFPFIHSEYYILNSLSTLIMTLTAPIILLIFYKKLKGVFPYIIFGFSLILFTLYGLGTHINLLNTYLLIPLALFIFGFIFLLKDKWKWILPVLILLFTTTIYKSYTRPANEGEMYRYFVEQEPNCKVIQAVLVQSLSSNDIDYIERYFPKWVNYNCKSVTPYTMYFIPLIRTYIILLSPQFSNKEKRKLFHLKFDENNHLFSLMSYLELKDDNFKKLEEYLLKFNLNGERSLLMHENYPIFKEVSAYCNKNNNKGCINFKKYLDKFKDSDFSLRVKKNPR